MHRAALSTLVVLVASTCALMLVVMGPDADAASLLDSIDAKSVVPERHATAAPSPSTRPRFQSYAPGLRGRSAPSSTLRLRRNGVKRRRVRHALSLRPHRARPIPSRQPIAFPTVHIRGRRHQWRSSGGGSSYGYIRSNRSSYGSFARQRYLDYLRQRRQSRYRSRAWQSRVVDSGLLGTASATSAVPLGMRASGAWGISPQLQALIASASATSTANAANTPADESKPSAADSSRMSPSDPHGALNNAIDTLLRALDPARVEGTHAKVSRTQATLLRAELRSLRADHAAAGCVETRCLRDLSHQLLATARAITSRQVRTRADEDSVDDDRLRAV